MSKVKDVKKSLQVGQLPFEMGGKQRSIQFDLNAFAELEARYGSVNEAMNVLRAGGMKGMRTMLWAGLIHEEVNLDPVTGEPISYNITPFQVGSWIKPQMLGDLSRVLTESIGIALPDVKNSPELKEAMQQLGISVNADGSMMGPDGFPMAVVVPTPEEQAEIDKESKNV